MSNAPTFKIIATGHVELLHENNFAIQNRIAAHGSEIDDIWNIAQSAQGVNLYNGSLLVYAGHTVEGDTVRVTGHFAEYKHFIAQRANPDLGLAVKPIGVSGMVTGRDENGPFTVFARRASHVSTYGGFLELVPSGAIDLSDARDDGSVDFAYRLFQEFEEEAGKVPPGAECAISGFAFLYDIPGGVYDICCRIQTPLPKEFYIESMARSDEYDLPECVPLRDIKEFVKQHEKELIPTSIGIIESFLQAR